MISHYSPEDLCPKCGGFISTDNPHPYVLFKKCEECGYTKEVSTLGDKIDEAMDLFSYND